MYEKQTLPCQYYHKDSRRIAPPVKKFSNFFTDFCSADTEANTPRNDFNNVVSMLAAISRRPQMKTSYKAALGLTATLLTANLLAPVQAQPDARAQVAPQPVENVKRKRQKGAGQAGARVAQPDKMVTNFEEMFGRKLTDEQKAELTKASQERQAAMRAAQQQWMQQFLKVTGVTEGEYRAKLKESRKKKKDAEPAAR
jgi:hypothetical protein